MLIKNYCLLLLKNIHIYFNIFQWENQEVFVDFFDYPEQLFPFFNITDKI